MIYENYTRAEQVSRYTDEQLGIDKLNGVLTGVRMDNYYPYLKDKVTYLFTQINKGHFFSNGNKRLALVVAIVFLSMNEYELKASTKEDYRNLLLELFPSYTPQDFPEFESEEYGLYNLSFVVARSDEYVGADFDEIKRRVSAFFAASVTPHG